MLSNLTLPSHLVYIFCISLTIFVLVLFISNGHSPANLANSSTRRHSPKAIFEKNVTRLDKFAGVIGESREFGASGHCLVIHLLDFNFDLLT
jgi:hypothetical protein